MSGQPSPSKSAQTTPNPGPVTRPTPLEKLTSSNLGAGLPRFSPRQADVLFVVGTISHKMAPVLKRIYDQMADPKWVVSFGVCTCTGGFYDNYATVMGIDTIIPVDVYIPGCPPRPEYVLDGLLKLQARIQAQHTSGQRPAAEGRPEFGP